MDPAPTHTASSREPSATPEGSRTHAQAHQGLGRHLSRRMQLRLLVDGSLVGLCAGGVVTAYRLALMEGEHLMRAATSVLGASLGGVALWFCVLATLCVAVSLLVKWEPRTAGSGIPETVAEVAGKVSMSWPRVMVAKFCEGALGALAGLSLGREGPSVQLGGMAGKAVSETLGRRRGERKILVTCGAAAGMAAAFHAPLTGVMFALEEIHKAFTPQLIIAVMMASVVSDFFVSQVLGVEPVLAFAVTDALPHASYLFVIALGLLLGVLGALHNRGMFQAQRLFSHIERGLPFARYAIAFAVAGVVVFLAPELCCGGDAIIEYLHAGVAKPMGVLALLLVGKYLFTALCFGSGAPGGTLFPLVVLGAVVGFIAGEAASVLGGLPSGYIANFCVLGIAGMFAGVIRAPVTAIVLAFELTGSLESLLAVVIVSIIAYVTANLMNVDPFYEHLYDALLAREAADAQGTDPVRKSQAGD